MLALVWAVLAAVAGLLATYYYDEEAGLGMRLAQGLPLGFTVLALVAYGVTANLGYGADPWILTPLELACVGYLGWRHRQPLQADLRRLPASWASWLWLLPTGLFLGFLLWRVLIFQEQSLWTGFDNNLGDLTFHLGIIDGFAFGDNFPPEHPEYCGTRLTYPFLVDFLISLAMSQGAPTPFAMWVQNVSLTLALLALLYRFAFSLTGSRLAAALTPVLFLGSGGVGGWQVFKEVAGGASWLHLPHEYTINIDGYRWGNTLTVMLVPQRALLLGLPLALMIWRLWWKGVTSAEEGPARRHLLAAGVLTGILPLAHAHTYVTVMLLSAGMALAFVGQDGQTTAYGPAFVRQAKRWIWYWGPALGLAAPQMLWATHGAAAKAGNFFGLWFGWDRGDLPPDWFPRLPIRIRHLLHALAFWWRNLGLFIPLWLGSLAWLRRARPQLLRYHLPFAGLFVLANVFKLSPWVWDNIKVLFVWFLGSAPLVALVIARLPRLLTPLLVGALIFSGSLDVWRVLVHTSLHIEYDPAAVELAWQVRQHTPERARFLTGGSYNNPIELAGRRLILGYGGHLWSQGLDYSAREAAVKEIYAGGPQALNLLQEHKVDYVLIGPQERGDHALMVNEAFFNQFPLVLSGRDYKLFKISK